MFLLSYIFMYTTCELDTPKSVSDQPGYGSYTGLLAANNNNLVDQVDTADRGQVHDREDWSWT